MLLPTDVAINVSRPVLNFENMGFKAHFFCRFGMREVVKDQKIIAAELENLGYTLVDIEREAGGLLRVTIENPDYERLITVWIARR